MKIRLLTVITTLFLSFLLTACGGGSKPGDEGERSFKAAGTGNATGRNTFLTDTSGNILSRTERNAEQFCQQVNTLLCEDFEWSSSLVYKATNSDWFLKGWQYNGVANSGNQCNSIGADDTQCALVFVQMTTASVDNSFKAEIQEAKYTFSEYGAGEDSITVSWKAKWSSNWLWDKKESPFVAIESLDENKNPNVVVAFEFDSAGTPQLVINDDYACGFGDKIIKADSRYALVDRHLGQWHAFKLVFDLDNAANTLAIDLSQNNKVVVTTVIDVSCGTILSGYELRVNSIAFSVKAGFDNIIEQQRVEIDSVLVTF